VPPFSLPVILKRQLAALFDRQICADLQIFNASKINHLTRAFKSFNATTHIPTHRQRKTFQVSEDDLPSILNAVRLKDGNSKPGPPIFDHSASSSDLPPANLTADP
jgi:hypothetical protein